MRYFGIMQGRLVPPDGERFQSFPRERWIDEFAFAKAASLSYIEWIYDAYGEDVNPLGTDHGILEMHRLIESYGVQVRALCADWFMDYPFLRCGDKEREFRQRFLNHLLRSVKTVGVQRVVLPFVEISRIATAEEENTVVEVLEKALPIAEDTGVELHLETDLSPANFRRLLNRVVHPLLKVNYDSGNSSSLGYRPAEEFDAYGDRIGSIHIKDRLLGGGTVALGSGDADFEAVFAGMKKIQYAGDITMQVARGEPGEEVAWAKRNLAWITAQIEQES